jgi:hypothetical protein
MQGWPVPVDATEVELLMAPCELVSVLLESFEMVFALLEAAKMLN